MDHHIPGITERIRIGPIGGRAVSVATRLVQKLHIGVLVLRMDQLSCANHRHRTGRFRFRVRVEPMATAGTVLQHRDLLRDGLLLVAFAALLRTGVQVVLQRRGRLAVVERGEIEVDVVRVGLGHLEIVRLVRNWKTREVVR